MEGLLTSIGHSIQAFCSSRKDAPLPKVLYETPSLRIFQSALTKLITVPHGTHQKRSCKTLATLSEERAFFILTSCSENLLHAHVGEVHEIADVYNAITAMSKELQRFWPFRFNRKHTIPKIFSIIDELDDRMQDVSRWSTTEPHQCVQRQFKDDSNQTVNHLLTLEV